MIGICSVEWSAYVRERLGVDRPDETISAEVAGGAELAEIGDHFAVAVSSEEVGRGRPAPDVYLEAARRLAVAPAGCVAIEDSHNGILSAAAAGMRVISIPSSALSPADDALGVADEVLERIDELSIELVA